MLPPPAGKTPPPSVGCRCSPAALRHPERASIIFAALPMVYAAGSVWEKLARFTPSRLGHRAPRRRLAGFDADIAISAALASLWRRFIRNVGHLQPRFKATCQESAGRSWSKPSLKIRDSYPDEPPIWESSPPTTEKRASIIRPNTGSLSPSVSQFVSGRELRRSASER